MEIIKIGKIIRINGFSVKCLVSNSNSISKISTDSFNLSHLSIGALVGTRLVDGRILVLSVDEIYQQDDSFFFNANINGVYDEVLDTFSFGTNSYPLIGENVFKMKDKILKNIFEIKGSESSKDYIGNYYYNPSVRISYNPNAIFGKHLGVFGNTGCGKTCTVASLVQSYIRSNPRKNIKFVILDVNGEYRSAFTESESEFYDFSTLNLNHQSLDLSEYGRLFRASEGIQYPALKKAINSLSAADKDWKLADLPGALSNWVEDNSNDNFINRNQLNGYLRSMILRIDDILRNKELMNVIDGDPKENTFTKILESKKKVQIIDLQTSTESLDIILYLLFKEVYLKKSFKKKERTHICLVLEEAHRYINSNVQETKLGSYYIDKLAREGRKFGIGMIISSQIPSMLSYEIVSQCNSVIMHKITNKKDLEFLRNVLRISSETFFLQMSSLEKQYAIVCGEAFANDTIVRIKDAYPLPLSKDPVIDDVK